MKNDDGTPYTDKCTSCTLINVENPQRETKKHLYIDCPKAVEIIGHIKDVFGLTDPIQDEEIIFFSNHEDYWERLKRNLIFLDFKIYLNRCRRANILPNKDDAILLIQKTFLMLFKTNPSDEKLIDGLLPIITGRGLSLDQAKTVIMNANNCPDSSKILFESQRRNIFLSSKISSNIILNSAGIDLVAKQILNKYESYAALS